jgi:hypothetical protein
LFNCTVFNNVSNLNFICTGRKPGYNIGRSNYIRKLPEPPVVCIFIIPVAVHLDSVAETAAVKLHWAKLVAWRKKAKQENKARINVKFFFI